MAKKRKIELWELFRLADASLDQSISAVAMPRVVAATIFVVARDRRTTSAVFNRVSRVVTNALKDNGFSPFEEKWGPYEGSRIQTIFATSDDFILGSDFRGRLAGLREIVQYQLPKVRKGTIVIVVLGDLAIRYAGGPQQAAQLLHLPVAMMMALWYASGIKKAVDDLKKAFEERQLPSSETEPGRRRITFEDDVPAQVESRKRTQQTAPPQKHLLAGRS